MQCQQPQQPPTETQMHNVAMQNASVRGGSLEAYDKLGKHYVKFNNKQTNRQVYKLKKQLYITDAKQTYIKIKKYDLK